ncbi:hypothetical protein AJ78_02930 [Emergomyces pasteurianus Ep9510]|uniref:Uncharacterized protein n=1 Tax=Emergomyces pasteurianus Ep9510 TaxID=1447872 RepID=A0A1J9QM29_9EURO|nr:hypothetical protein AJ78_02930 [Emergomyces pasteurianus Ep9510]
MIHVTGNAATGFHLEFRRNYNFSNTNTRHEIIPLAEINDNLASTSPNGSDLVTSDTTARDQLESIATVITPQAAAKTPLTRRLQTVKPGYASMSRNWVNVV